MFTFGKVNSELQREGGERGSWFAAFVQGVCADGEWEASTRAEVVTSLLRAQFWLPTVFAGHICWDSCVGNQKTLFAHFVDGRNPIRDCEYWLLCSLFRTGLFFFLFVSALLSTYHFSTTEAQGKGCMSGDIKMSHSTLWCSLSFHAQASDQGEFFFRTMVGLSGARS